MPFSNYGDLKQAVQDWMDRTDIAGNVDDFVTLAEAGLNRELEALEVDTTLTSTENERTISTAALGVETPISVWMNYYGREVEILKLQDGDFPFTDSVGTPWVWGYQEDAIVFNRPLSAGQTFRLHHTVKFDLVDDGDTNWLLLNHPDVYLSAAIVWGGKFTDDNPKVQGYGSLLGSFIASVNSKERRKKRGTLVVDAGLSSIGRNNQGFWR
jgi:hypothetical protein